MTVRLESFYDAPQNPPGAVERARLRLAPDPRGRRTFL